MTEEERFMAELDAETERKQEKQTEAYFDLLLLQILNLNEEIAYNFAEAEKEVKIINDWALAKNHAMQEKIDMLERKLEAFIREKKVKTIDLPHGVLKCHKKPDKVEITDIELFLKHAKPELLTIVPETVKPNLSKIKDYLIMSYNGFPGVTLTQGKEEFSYKLNKEANNGRQEEIRTSIEPAMFDRIAI